VAALVRYAWPGNIRELKNALWRASILAEGQPIGPEHLGLGEPAASSAGGGAADAAAGASPVTLAEAERRAIGAALAATAGNKVRAAELLGIARSTLNEKLRRTGTPV
jgi:two-component system response regulator HydG